VRSDGDQIPKTAQENANTDNRNQTDTNMDILNDTEDGELVAVNHNATTLRSEEELLKDFYDTVQRNYVPGKGIKPQCVESLHVIAREIANHYVNPELKALRDKALDALDAEDFDLAAETLRESLALMVSDRVGKSLVEMMNRAIAEVPQNTGSSGYITKSRSEATKSKISTIWTSQEARCVSSALIHGPTLTDYHLADGDSVLQYTGFQNYRGEIRRGEGETVEKLLELVRNQGIDAVLVQHYILKLLSDAADAAPNGGPTVINLDCQDVAEKCGMLTRDTREARLECIEKIGSYVAFGDRFFIYGQRSIPYKTKNPTTGKTETVNTKFAGKMWNNEGAFLWADGQAPLDGLEHLNQHKPVGYIITPTLASREMLRENRQFLSGMEKLFLVGANTATGKITRSVGFYFSTLMRIDRDDIVKLNANKLPIQKSMKRSAWLAMTEPEINFDKKDRNLVVFNSRKQKQNAEYWDKAMQKLFDIGFIAEVPPLTQQGINIKFEDWLNERVTLSPGPVLLDAIVNWGRISDALPPSKTRRATRKRSKGA
jgi:hypothetical protein